MAAALVGIASGFAPVLTRGERVLHRGPPSARAHGQEKEDGPSVPREAGTALNWHADKGFGFIRPDGGGANVFCHKSAIVDGSSLVVGSKVEFNRASTPDDTPGRGSTRAERVTGSARLSGGPRRSTAPTADGAGVFVRNIPVGTTEQQIREALSPFGEIVSVSFPKIERGAGVQALEHFGFAMVAYRHSSDAARALVADAPLITGIKLTIEKDVAAAAGREALLQQLKQCRSKMQVDAVAKQLGKPRSVREANKLIVAWGRAKECRRATTILETMRLDGLAPELKTYSAAMTACEKVGEWEGAIELLHEMQREGIRPDVISFNAAMAACLKGGNYERALGLLDGIPAAGVEPDVITLGTAIAVCVRGKFYERALALKVEMQRRGLPLGTPVYSSLMECCRKLGRWEQGLALLEEVRVNGLVANAMIYDPLIRALCRAGEVTQATDVYRVACAEGVYTPRGEGQDPRTIDLHGLRREIACIAVSGILDELRRAPHGGKATTTPEQQQRDRRRPLGSSPDDLVIITGRGKGSKYLTHQTPVIKVAITEMLYLPEYTALEATEAVGNPGCLIVKGASLCAWRLAESHKEGRQGKSEEFADMDEEAIKQLTLKGALGKLDEVIGELGAF